MAPEELREICRLTAELTRISQGGCAHLCVDQFAVDLFGRLLVAYHGHGGAVTIGPIVPVDLSAPGAMGKLRNGVW